MKKMFSLIIILLSIICCDKVFTYEEYKIGDKVTYGDGEYYVIEDSDSSTNYVTLLKDKLLTKDELYKYGRDENDHLFINEYIINSDNPQEIIPENDDGTGCIAFYTSETCDYELYWDVSWYRPIKVTSGCQNDYELSDVKKVLDNWSETFDNDLVVIDGYKIRLISMDDLFINLDYNLNNFTGGFYQLTDDVQEFVYNGDYNYWTMSDVEDSSYSKYTMYYYGNIFISDVSSFEAVRPVINLKKCKIDGSKDNCDDVCTNNTVKINRYKTYATGDEIEYEGNKYYVIKNSSKATKYITLLKAEPLTYDEINNNKGNLDIGITKTDNNIGLMSYYTSDTCNSDENKFGCTNAYDKSNIKVILDNWSKDYDLVSVGGYKVRLINENDLIALGYENQQVGTNISTKLTYTELTPNWVYGTNYWSMETFDGSNQVYVNTIYGVLDTYFDSQVYNVNAVRPVINLNKCVVGGCYEEEIQVEDSCIEDNTSIVGNDNKTIVNVENTLK